MLSKKNDKKTIDFGTRKMYYLRHIVISTCARRTYEFYSPDRFACQGFFVAEF